MRLVDDAFIKKAVEQYSDMIFRIAFQHTKNMADTEDIAQEVFLALIRQTPFSNERYLKSWIIRVTINKCKDLLKSAAKKKTVAFDEEYHYLTQDQNNVIKELQNLSETDRNVIYLFHYEGYSAKEIGIILGKKESAIFMNLKRARHKLKKLLEDDYDGQRI